MFDDTMNSELVGISLDLITESVIAKSLSSINNILKKKGNLVSMISQRDHVVGLI